MAIEIYSFVFSAKESIVVILGRWNEMAESIILVRRETIPQVGSVKIAEETCTIRLYISGRNCPLLN